MNDAEVLVGYIRNLPNFSLVTEMDGNYRNMGATIIDGILQAGTTYETVVKPRVRNYLMSHPNVTTVTAFKRLCEEVTIPTLLNWREGDKPERIRQLTNLLIREHVETEDDFHNWLSQNENIEELKRIRGIAEKTADYLKILVGYNDAIAVDRHLMNFLNQASIFVGNYNEAQAVIAQAARIMNVREAHLDHSIWRYMSNADANQQEA